MLYNVHRPKLFSDVVGQESELNVIKAMLEKSWRPSAIMLTGGYGTGKTTIARLIARALLCDHRNGVEPCGVCENCISMDTDSNAAYLEIDSACLPPYAMVRLADGNSKKIAEIVRDRLPVSVLSYNYDTEKIESRQVVNWFCKKSSGDFRRFHLGGTRGPLTCTPEHKLWDGLSMRESSSFKVGESLYLRQYLLSDEQKQVVWGSLLGDSSRNWKSRSTAGFVVQQSDAHRSYFEWKRAYFTDIISADCDYESVAFGGSHKCLRSLTDWSQQMKEVTDQFYDGQWKRLWLGSLDCLGPLGMAVWVMDDGSFNGNSITLHTSGFSKEDHEEISRWLTSQGYAHSILVTGRGHRIVNIHKESAVRLGHWIAPFMEESMMRKIPEECRVLTTTRQRVGGAWGLLPRVIEEIEELNQNTLQYDLEVEGNHNYFAADILVSNSNGLVADIRTLRDEASYRAVGGKQRIVVLDESHMISVQGQNAMLQLLEEGKDGVLFMFATTEAEKMLPTIRSRCVELSLKLLTAAEIYKRLLKVVEVEKVEYDDKALKVIATYVRGHMRDALVLLEQLIRMSPRVSEDLVRTHLRLDKLVELYELLTEKEKAKILVKLENLLCHQSPGDLAESLGQVLIDTYKMHLGVGEYSQVDLAWMKKVLEAQGLNNLLERAERVLSLNTDFASIQYGLAAFMRIFEQEGGSTAPTRSLMPGVVQPAIAGHRKPVVNRGE